MEKVMVNADAEVNPTESEAKVRRAIESIFGDIPMTVKQMRRGSVVTAQACEREPLIKLYNILRRQHIRAAARTVLLAGIDRNTISFCLNKQAAYVGHVSFAEEVAESPLGPIRVRIESENPRGLVEWLTSAST